MEHISKYHWLPIGDSVTWLGLEFVPEGRHSKSPKYHTCSIGLADIILWHGNKEIIDGEEVSDPKPRGFEFFDYDIYNVCFKLNKSGMAVPNFHCQGTTPISALKDLVKNLDPCIEEIDIIIEDLQDLKEALIKLKDRATIEDILT